jgi:hypothetical protein
VLRPFSDFDVPKVYFYMAKQKSTISLYIDKDAVEMAREALACIHSSFQFKRASGGM